MWGIAMAYYTPNYAAYASHAWPQKILEDDNDWNQTLFVGQKSFQLQKLFEAMNPCIQSCILSKFGSVTEMLPQACLLYRLCQKIILKNLENFPNLPPSMFSAAVHQHVMHQGLYADERWRVICCLFEYITMEMCAAIKQQQPQQHNYGWQEAKNWVFGGISPHPLVAILPRPHAIMHQTNQTVQKTHDDLQEMHDKLDYILNWIKSQR
jgi:hypothetical protein